MKQTNQQPQKQWQPEPGKYEAEWKKTWFGIIESRRFQIAQTHGNEAAKRYRPHSWERKYFMSWGKLPHAVIGQRASSKSIEWVVPPCEVCDVDTAKEIVMVIDEHHARFWAEMNDAYKSNVEQWQQRINKQIKRVEATEQYKADKEDRERRVKYSEDAIKNFRNLKADDKAQHQAGQQGQQAASDGAKAADSTETDTNTTAE